MATNRFSRFRAIGPWLAEAKYLWLATGVIVAALAVCLTLIWLVGPDRAEPVVRIAGLFLELLGISTVIWGISDTRSLFGHPSFRSKIKAWFARFPLLRVTFMLEQRL